MEARNRRIRHFQIFRYAAKFEGNFEIVFIGCEVPELMLKNNGYLFRVFFSQTFVDFSAWIAAIWA